MLESDELKLNLSADDIAKVIETTDKDNDGVSMAEFIPVVQALYFRRRAKTAVRRRLPGVKGSRARSALERSMRTRPLSGRASPQRTQSAQSPRMSPAKRRWQLVREKVAKGMAERVLAMPDQIDRLDFVTITQLMVGGESQRSKEREREVERERERSREREI